VGGTRQIADARTVGEQRGTNPTACALRAEEWVGCMPIRASVRSAGGLAVSIARIASVRTAESGGRDSAHVRFIPVTAVTSEPAESR
jgi:hypothetical protein